ncbi:mCG1029207, partial [Mus musculus]
GPAQPLMSPKCFAKTPLTRLCLLLSSGALLIDHPCKPILYKSTLFNQVKRKCLPCSVRRVHVPGG